jgi:Mrp family chromosome partitioning ATPase
VLPAGRLTKSPHKLLAGDGFAQLLAQLRRNYRCIIIDTPPVLSASEALLLAKMADGAIVCTRRNYSRERQVRLAYERLLSAGARPLGAVFNAVPARQYASTYGSYDYARMDLLDSR